jgi:xanthine dehydrogenase accessory factor
VLEALNRWTARGDAVATATVVGVKRSAPRPLGAKMAISSSGDVSGQVSGGCVEGAVVQQAQEVLAGGPPRLLHFGIEDAEAWAVGLPCGGEVSVWVSGAPHERFAQVARDGGRGGLATRMDDGRAMFVGDDRTTDGDLGDPALSQAAAARLQELWWQERSEMRQIDGVEVFLDATYPDPRLVILGAVDVAVSLCRIARATNWRPSIVDPRGLFARRDRFPDAEHVLVAWPQEGFVQLGGIDRGTSVVVLTHDPKLDDAALRIALRSEASYIGAMGSRRSQDARRERLAELGFSDREIARVSAPVGLDIGAMTPEEMAISIMAEVVAVRRGRAGGRLRASTGRIHEVSS